LKINSREGPEYENNKFDQFYMIAILGASGVVCYDGIDGPPKLSRHKVGDKFMRGEKIGRVRGKQKLQISLYESWARDFDTNSEKLSIDPTHRLTKASAKA
jgi:hypothetical protein